MADKEQKQRPRCYTLLWIVLAISALSIIKKHFLQETSIHLPDKLAGILVGIGIVLFGLIVAQRKSKSGRAVQNE